MIGSLLLGFLLAALVALPAVAIRALTRTGAAAAIAVGGFVYAGGGVSWAAVLLAFFVTSSLLSRLSPGDNSPAQKSGPRDAHQVLANGSLPALYALFAAALPVGPWALLCCGAIATAAADTWATEIGRSSAASPRSIRTGRRVPTGTSGGITARGLGGAVGGAIMVAATGGFSGMLSPVEVVSVASAGFAGCMLDSLLGATAQEQRFCPCCSTRTEHLIHRPCGCPTSVVAGRPGFDNDAVNLAACAGGSTFALLFQLALAAGH